VRNVRPELLNSVRELATHRSRVNGVACMAYSCAQRLPCLIEINLRDHVLAKGLIRMLSAVHGKKRDFVSIGAQQIHQVE
jgi:hypothetical protein